MKEELHTYYQRKTGHSGKERSFKQQKERIENFTLLRLEILPQMVITAWSGTGVTKWLSEIACAEHVITNSFHGIVFSVLFQRTFTALRLKGELKERNGRIDELLERLGIDREAKTCGPVLSEPAAAYTRGEINE